MNKGNSVILHYRIITRSEGGGAWMKEINVKAVGRRIKEARVAKGFTQEELAAQVDMSAQHISVIERGLKIPNLDTFVLIANALKVSADRLLIDVVDEATEGVSTELTEMLASVPVKERGKIFKVIRTMVEE